ncbi:hypothetical protein FB45DRAFT_895627 [Roridomyces roridus]|uniref:Uncharacterized protein n=1 Tax=Roridomyces roridus TaxID=1738132 RepID=A0AAD7FXG9_9AGAR|nr:hypothetical protein FB45DRAFT_895627 [Roridomyces roridus]
MNFPTAAADANPVKTEEREEKTQLNFLAQLPLAHQSSPCVPYPSVFLQPIVRYSPAATEEQAGEKLQQLLCMADAFNRYPGECTERRIARELSRQLVELAHLRNAPVDFMTALKLGHRIGDYTLINLVETARIQKLQACATHLASTLNSTTWSFPVQSREQQNFVLDSRTATVLKIIGDFEREMADARDLLNLAKSMREVDPDCM